MDADGPSPAQTTPSPLTDEIANREREAEDKAERCDRKSGMFSWLRYALGIPGAVFAVAAGSTALAGTPGGVTASVAFLSAAFSTAHALGNPDARRTKYALLRADYADLARRAHRCHIAAPTMDPAEQLGALEELNTLMHALDRSVADTGIGQV